MSPWIQVIIFKGLIGTTYSLIYTHVFVSVFDDKIFDILLESDL